MDFYTVTGTQNDEEYVVGRDLSFEAAIALIKEKNGIYEHLAISEERQLKNMPTRFVIVADCNMMLKELKALLAIPKEPTQQVVFLGNYIANGEGFYAFMSYLVELTKKRDCVFVKGRNEHNLLEYIHQTDAYIGDLKEVAAMVRKIESDLSFPLYSLPEKFPEFYAILNESVNFYENDRYIFVSGGLDLTTEYWKHTADDLLLETTETFLLTPNETGKKVVFGNQSVRYLNKTTLVRPWFNVKRDKIGINGDCKNKGKLLGMFIYEESIYYLGIRNMAERQRKNDIPLALR